MDDFGRIEIPVPAPMSYGKPCFNSTKGLCTFPQFRMVRSYPNDALLWTGSRSLWLDTGQLGSLQPSLRQAVAHWLAPSPVLAVVGTVWSGNLEYPSTLRLPAC